MRAGCLQRGRVSGRGVKGALQGTACAPMGRGVGSRTASALAVDGACSGGGELRKSKTSMTAAMLLLLETTSESAGWQACTTDTVSASLWSEEPEFCDRRKACAMDFTSVLHVIGEKKGTITSEPFCQHLLWFSPRNTII